MNRYLYFKQQEENELYHHGIKGQKWGIRRFQNEDGSYTEEGRKRYGIGENGEMSKSGSIKYYKDYTEALSKEYDEKMGVKPGDQDSKYLEKKAKFIRKQYEKDGRDFESDQKAYQEQKARNARTGAIATVSALAVIGTTAYVGTQVLPQIADENYDRYSAKISRNYRARGADWQEDIENDTKDVTIPSGGNLYRVTPNKNEGGEGKDAIYVNVGRNEARAYNLMYAKGEAGAAKGQMYERKMKANQSLKIAGGKAIQDAINEVVEENPTLKSKRAVVWGIDLGEQNSPKTHAQHFISEYGLRDKQYGRDKEFNDKVTEKLKEKGYSGFKDFNDENALGKGQAILFDPDANVKNDKINKINRVKEVVDGLLLKDLVYYEEAKKK